MIYALPAPQVPADVEIVIVSTDLNDRPSLPIETVQQNVTSNESSGQEWLTAQVVPAQDGTNTTVEQTGNQYTIGGGQRSQNQENLFHSLEQFGLQAGEIADFLSDSQTRNMLVRVVGGDASLINGLLRVSGSNANFYLMNPAGVVFGNQASLDVPANFLTTTATGIGFGDGNWFSAIGDNSYEPLVGNPDALAFAIEQSGVIINSGDLAVAPGQSLALLGDLVINTGDLSAHNGQVILAAVSGENLVRISQEGQILSLEFSPLISDDSRPNAWVSDISDLPALLTDESIHHATDVVLHEDGTVTLSGSGIEIDVTNRRLFALGYTNFHGSLDLILADINSWEPSQDSVYTETPSLYNRLYVHQGAWATLLSYQNLRISISSLFHYSIGSIFDLNANILYGLGNRYQHLPAVKIQNSGIIPPYQVSPPQISNDPRPNPSRAPVEAANGSDFSEVVSAPEDVSSADSSPSNISTSRSPGLVDTNSTNIGRAQSTLVKDDQALSNPAIPNMIGIDSAPNLISNTPDEVLGSYQEDVSQMNHFWEQAIAFEFYGNYRGAIDNFQHSLRIARTQGDTEAEATLLANLGALYGAEGDYERAVETYRAGFQVARRHNLLEAEARLNLNLASAYLVQDNINDAELLLTEALAMSRDQDDRLLEAQVLSNLGTVRYSYGQYNDAIAYHRDAVAIAQEVGNHRLRGQTLNNLGHILFRSEQLDEAEAALRSAISNFEQIRPIHHDSYNISTFDTQILTYRLLEQVLVAKGDLGNALVASEEGRARAFIDLLSQQNTSPPLDGSQLSPTLNISPTLDQIRRIAQERDATIVQYSIISDPDFRFQGRQRGPDAELWIWVVQPDGTIEHQTVNLTDTDLQALVRDGHQSIGAHMRGDRPAHGIQVGDRVRRIGEPLSWQPYHVVAVNLDTGFLTLEHPEFAVPAPVPIDVIDLERLQQPESILPRLQALHHVLIQPIQDLLPQNPNDLVIFIPTEELFVVPFAALQAPDGSYLIEHHTITTSPSIQVLDFTAQRQQELSQLNPAQRAAPLVVGNPSPMPLQLDNLPYAETEAEAIAQMLNTRPLIGAEATETEVRRRLETASIIHFATHGLFNETTPLQGAIAFSPDHEQDGLLTAEELLGYSLQAKLVVLSACATGRGQITGDGVLGLSRSLLASGTPSALVSLWQVPDDTTATLMTLFYQYQRTEPTYAHALRQAMLNTLRQNPHPHQWAAFTLIGEAGEVR